MVLDAYGVGWYKSYRGMGCWYRMLGLCEDDMFLVCVCWGAQRWYRMPNVSPFFLRCQIPGHTGSLAAVNVCLLRKRAGRAGSSWRCGSAICPTED